MNTQKRRSLLTNPIARSVVLGTTVLLSGASMADAQQRQVPILLYGPVETQASGSFWVSQANFQAQMQELKNRGYETITIDQYVAHINNPAANPIAAAKPIILTFTNGYRNVRTIVDPVLAQHGFKATAFLLPAHIGGNNSWDTGDDGTTLNHLSWADVTHLQGTGRWEFGSHTRTHARLPDLTATQRQAEIAGSKEDIDAQINGTIRYFSYPFGAGTTNNDIRTRIQNAGYTAALGVQGQDTTNHNDRFALPRLYVTRDVTINQLFGPTFLNETPTGEFHPADTNQDWRIGISELTAFGAKWRAQDPNATIANLTRAGFLWRQNRNYRYDASASGAARWVPVD